LLSYADKASGSNSCIVSLIRIKAVDRQCYKFFNWEQKKIGPFYTLLGDNIGASLKEMCSRSPGAEQAKAFLEIGYLRNCLVHQNYATYILENSADDIRGLCEEADKFVCNVEKLLV
jgi:hypothetical protein